MRTSAKPDKMVKPGLGKKVVFLTHSEDADTYVVDDELLAWALQEDGAEVATIPWQTADMSVLQEADVVMLRSVYDYVDHFDRFCAFLDALEAHSVNVWNPVPLIRWNSVKTYLRELRDEHDVPVAPMRWDVPLTQDALEPLFAEWGVDELIVKPNVGASATRIHRLPRAGLQDALASARRDYADPAATRGHIVMPFLATIRDGEVSMIFLGGRLSHTILKTPVSGDFRSQEEFGAAISVQETENNEQLVAATLALSSIQGEHDVHYARVDMVRVEVPDGGISDPRWAVMEVELIEPSLYFRKRHPAAATQMGDYILHQMGVWEEEW